MVNDSRGDFELYHSLVGPLPEPILLGLRIGQVEYITIIVPKQKVNFYEISTALGFWIIFLTARLNSVQLF